MEEEKRLAAREKIRKKLMITAFLLLLAIVGMLVWLRIGAQPMDMLDGYSSIREGGLAKVSCAGSRF